MNYEPFEGDRELRIGVHYFEVVKDDVKKLIPLIVAKRVEKHVY